MGDIIDRRACTQVSMIVGVAGDGEIGEAGEVVLIARGFTFIGELMFVALKFDYHMYTS